MFSFRRFCVGAALGLSLLACGPAHAAPNLLRNAGFETSASSFAPWKVTGNAKVGYSSTLTPVGAGVSKDTASTGKGLAIFTPTASGKSGTGTITQSVHFSTTGVPYHLVAHLSLGGTTFFSDGLRTTGGGNHKVAVATTLHHPTPLAYFPVTGTVTPTKATEQVYFIGHGGKNVLWMDNVSLSRVTAPVGAPEVDAAAGAPALAIALGGLALMTERRRRKLGPEGLATAAE